MINKILCVICALPVVSACTLGNSIKSTETDSIEVVGEDTLLIGIDACDISAPEVVEKIDEPQLLPLDTKKKGYNPPKARDLSKENKRYQQIWGAFDQGQIAGYEAGYNDGKRNTLYRNFNSSYPTSDEWIEQSYIQGYECGYLDGYDDAGGER